MSGQTRAGSARLNAYHGTKRQLIGTSAGQVAPAWRTSNGTDGTAAINGKIAPLSKKALQWGSKILLSNLPMDVAEAEVEVGIFSCFLPYIIPSLLVGAVQENGRSRKGHVYHLQQPRAIEGNGYSYFSPSNRCWCGTVKVRWQGD